MIEIVPVLHFPPVVDTKPPLCKWCKHWDRWTQYSEPSDTGTCSGVRENDVILEEGEEFDTNENFGCIHWEQK